MKLILAQGNPGAQYARTRHNVGFMMLDTFADQHSTNWKLEKKFNAEIATLSIDGEKVLLVKPLSFYNETGRTVRALLDFYKGNPATDLLVLHDELALPFGEIRTRQKGSDAGNNGIKSINSHVGQDYARVRIGIWNALRDRIDDADFVLSSFTQSELTTLKNRYAAVIKPIITDFIAGEFTDTTYRPPKLNQPTPQ